MTNPPSKSYADQFLIEDFDDVLPSASPLFPSSFFPSSSSPVSSSFLPPPINLSQEPTGRDRVENFVEEIRSLQDEETGIKRLIRRKHDVLTSSVMETLNIKNERTLALHHAFMRLNKVLKTEPKLKTLIMKKITKTYISRKKYVYCMLCQESNYVVSS